MTYDVKANEKYGFFEVTPKPTYDEVDKFYREDFYDEERSFNDSSLDVQNRDLEFNIQNWQREIEIVASITGSKPKSILDIGCGWCKYIEWASQQKIEVKGLDPSPESSDYGKSLGLEVLNTNFEDLVELDNKFDLVVLKNVLEHVIDPISFITQIYDKYMRKGSVLQIEVPNEYNDFQVAAQKLHGLSDWWVCPPAHLNYFSSQTLENLCHGVGLTRREARASFPMELFLLMGRNYVGDSALGSKCHSERKVFEQNMIELGFGDTLDRFYTSLAEVGLGRQITMFLEK
jgi:2-polyprenyl-3-methyl-5-hydroxy-6-metoxy-1,4-benzoquinol methylase